MAALNQVGLFVKLWTLLTYLITPNRVSLPSTVISGSNLDNRSLAKYIALYCTHRHSNRISTPSHLNHQVVTQHRQQWRAETLARDRGPHKGCFVVKCHNTLAFTTQRQILSPLGTEQDWVTHFHSHKRLHINTPAPIPQPPPSLGSTTCGTKSKALEHLSQAMRYLDLGRKAKQAQVIATALPMSNRIFRDCSSSDSPGKSLHYDKFYQAFRTASYKS